jgi:hypothetical protein
MRLADNVVGISINPLQTLPHDDMTAVITDSVIVGASANAGCGYHGNSAQCTEGDGTAQEKNGCTDRIGLYTVNFSERDFLGYKFFPPPPPYLPWHKVKTDSQFRGSAMLDGLTFVNFTDSSLCGVTNAVIRTNPTSADLHPVHTVSQTTLHNVDANALLYFDQPNPLWLNLDDCDGDNCTGLFNVVIRDMDGSFLGTSGSALSTSPFSIANPTTCQFQPSWNGHQCGGASEYGLMVFESLDPDTFTRRVSPVYVTSSDGYDSHNRLNSFMDHRWALSYTSSSACLASHLWLSLGERTTLHSQGPTRAICALQ